MLVVLVGSGGLVVELLDYLVRVDLEGTVSFGINWLGAEGINWKKSLRVVRETW